MKRKGELYIKYEAQRGTKYLSYINSNIKILYVVTGKVFGE